MNEISNIQKIETEIVVLKEQIAGNFIQIGQKLIQAKEEVEHGEWENWLESKVDFSRTQAYKLMQIAKDTSGVHAHGHLGQTKVFSLLSLSMEEREQFIESNPVEDMTTRELDQAIKDKKRLEREKEQEKNRRLEIEKQFIELKNREPEIIEKIVTKEVTPRDYEDVKNQNKSIKEQIDRLNEEALKIGTSKQRKAELDEKIKQIEVQYGEKEKALIQMEALVKVAEQDQSLTTLRKRLVREVNGAVDQLKRNKTGIEQLYKETIDVGENARKVLINEAKFLKEMAKIFEVMAGENDFVDVKSYEVIEIEGEL